MRESSKSALGGIIAALAVSIMLITYISPFLVYTAPPFAGILLIIIVAEIGYKWAIGTYTAISLLSLFLIADKEAAVFFVMLFGYYPILREFLYSKLKNKIVLTLLKIFIFNLSLFVSICISNYVFGIDYSEFSSGGLIMVLLFALAMNAILFLYDFLIAKVSLLYKSSLQKKIRKLFK
ncbi:MAG: hypothetical protein J1E34_03295 [Oscillospiraceae bacterium]|nr:hypothetical protein [Oscillospiraceae bacterium]